MLPIFAKSNADNRRSIARLSMDVLRTQAALLLIVAAVQFVESRPILADSPERPNIVLILADDMGYGDVQALNPASKIPTPQLNKLAAAGMVFTDAHTPSSVCTPTRYGLLTGRYCWRSRLKRGVLNGYGTPLIEKDRPTLASFLSRHGYDCGIVGKWHLGLDFAKSSDGKGYDFTQQLRHGPKELGFRYSYIIPASLDFPPYVYVENGMVTQPPRLEQKAQGFPAFLRAGPRSEDFVMEDCLDNLQEHASNFIRRQSTSRQQRPFFLYFPMTAPHKPVLPHRRFQGKTQLGPYGDFVAQVDATVGAVMKTLDECQVTDRTIVIYTSDNGSFMTRLDDTAAADHVSDATIQAYRADRHRANHVFRGTKADIWEAGHRVPFFVRWPKTVQPGSRCDQTICLTDVFATLADVIDETPSDEAARDSFSLLPLLHREREHVVRAPVIHHSAAGMFAIRDGNWKLVLGDGSGGRENPRGQPFRKPYALFDMNNDISEHDNLIDQHPDIAARLEAVLTHIRESGASK